MRPAVMRYLSFICLLATLTACLRAPSEVDPPGEGGFIGGGVLVLDPLTSNAVGRAGVEVTVVELGLTRRTNDDGRFRFSRIPLGRWRLRLYQPAGPDGVARERLLDPVDLVVEGETIELGSLELRDNGGLSGLVRTAAEDGATATPPGTLVVIAETSFKAVTNDRGAYLFATVPQGSYSVVAFRSGFAPARTGIEVGPGSIQTVRDIVLQPGETPVATVSGRVVLTDGTAASEVTVEFVNAQDPGVVRSGLTDDEGVFSIDDVPVGPYLTTFARQGYVPLLLDGVAVLPEATVGLGLVRLRPSPDGDIDGDGIANDQDDDRDNDGCPNLVDAAPTTACDAATPTVTASMTSTMKTTTTTPWPTPKRPARASMDSSPIR